MKIVIMICSTDLIQTQLARGIEKCPRNEVFQYNYPTDLKKNVGIEIFKIHKLKYLNVPCVVILQRKKVPKL